MDSTGFEARHISTHYVHRRGVRPHWRNRWPKVTICGHNRTHLILAATVTKGPCNDSPELPPVVRQAVRRVRLAGILADGAYDGEHHHRLCREELGIPLTAIPINPRNRKCALPGGRYRRRLFRRFPRRRYRQRWQVESIFSRHKRRLGSALTARSDESRARELLLRVLTHNLMILRLPLRPFNRALAVLSKAVLSTTRSGLSVLGRSRGRRSRSRAGRG
ncbi:MAG TPA: transposase [Planctomycetota bacterium]|nr:transposase [Planctomycetota bacterium]